MNHGSETDVLQNPDARRPPRGAIGCSAVDGMLQLGARRLTEEALHELADHLEVCAGCRAKFDALCLDESGEGVGGDTAAETPSIDLRSRLVKDVLDFIDGLRRQPQILTLVHQRSLGPPQLSFDQGIGQLARGQILRGTSRSFVVGERIGFGDFTETYAAKQVPFDTFDEELPGVRAVIKIPRIADDMSADAAIARLGELRAVIQVHAQALQNLAGLREVAGIVDCGDYV